MIDLIAWLLLVVCSACSYILYLHLKNSNSSLWNEFSKIKRKYISYEEYTRGNLKRMEQLKEYWLEPLRKDIDKQKYLLETLESKMNTNDRLNYARSNNRENIIVDAIDAIADYMNIEFVKKEGEKPIVRKKQSNKTKNKNGKHTINNRRVKK